jgi:hypothetical protein
MKMADFTGQQATLEGDGRTFAEIAANRQQEATCGLRLICALFKSNAWAI